MSLARIALRIAAVEALKGRTLVGDNVLDSPNGALDIQADGQLRTDEERPFISIYTDSGSAENVVGRSLIENGTCVLVIEAGISMAMTELNEETGASQIIGIAIPASDRSFEFFLDVVQREVLDALTDPDNAWAEIYRSLHTRVMKLEIGGKRNADDGQRLAGHQTRITLELMDDPLRGEPLPPSGPFARFLEAMMASDDDVYKKQAARLMTLVGGNDPDWKTLQRRHGMTAGQLLSLGRGPVAGDVDRLTPEMTTGRLEAGGATAEEVSS